MIEHALRRSLLELRKSSRLFASKFGLIVVVLLAMAMMVLPYLLKSNELVLGKESYYNLKIARDILDGELGYIKLGFGWPCLIALIGFIFDLKLEIAMSVLLFFLGVITAILFYCLLDVCELKDRFISSLVLVVSPIFIYLFVEGGKYVVPFVLFLLMGCFIFNKKYLKAGISFLFIPFFDLGSAIFIFLILICYFLYIKNRKWALGFVFLLLILNFFYFEGFNLNVVSDFGSKIGLSIFSVFLFAVGFGLFWRKRRFLLLYGISFLLFLFCLRFNWLLIYLNLFLSVLVGVCLIELFNRRWESDVIKNLTLLLLVCGLLFSGFSYVKAISEDAPDEEFFEALELIEDKAIVFSDVGNKEWISYAGKENVEIDENEFDDILMLRDAEISRFLLDKYNVEYILIDDKMKKNIWEGEMKGLIWVVNYDVEHFIKVYENRNVELWRYIRR